MPEKPGSTTMKIVQYNLKEAAGIIGISKKSLDDYLLQLRYGRKFGFDFDSHKESKVGVLRTFVKEQRDAYKKEHGVKKLTSKSLN